MALYTASYALVIGVSTYTGGWPSLPGVKEDVRRVQAALETQGFQVTVVLDPDKNHLEDAFEAFISAYGGHPEHRLLFYFAGHGHTVRPQYGGAPIGYLVPRDAPNPHDDPNGFKRIALSMQRIEEYALTIDAKHVLFLFDSCFSGSLFSLSRAIPAHINYKTAQPVRQFITSGDENEQVPDKSIFQQQFIAALQGDADRDGDGYITGTELGEFLQSQVVNYSKNAQHPQYGKIRHPGLDKGDFVFRVISATPSGSPVAVALDTRPDWQAERRRLEADRQRLAEERQRFEARRQAALRPGPDNPPRRAELPRVSAVLPPESIPRPPEQRPFFMSRPVNVADLQGKNPWELDVMRNEIYARHGRRFARQDLQHYFDQQPWYRGQYDPQAFPTTLLTEVQKRNAVFIQQYQRGQR
jgi:hypothetical protein